MRAETADGGRRRPAAVAGAKGAVQRALPLAAEHQTIDVIGAQVVFGQSEPEVQGVGVAIADAGLRLAVDVDFEGLVEARDVLAEDVLEPANHLHPALVRARQHVGDDVIARMIRSLLRRDTGAAVVLRMWRREVAAVIVVVVLLLAVIGQRATARLPPADAAAVGEGREEQRIDAADLRERVEHLVGAFVDERDRADLDADGRWRHLRRQRLRPSERGDTHGCRRRVAEKLSSIHPRALPQERPARRHRVTTSQHPKHTAIVHSGFAAAARAVSGRRSHPEVRFHIVKLGSPQAT